MFPAPVSNFLGFYMSLMLPFSNQYTATIQVVVPDAHDLKFQLVV
jgi:hypothetical protein